MTEPSAALARARSFADPPACRAVLTLGWLACAAITACGSSSGSKLEGAAAGAGHGGSGGTLIIPGSDGGASSGGRGGRGTPLGTLPAGFTMADIGGYKLGAPITGSDPSTGGSGGTSSTDGCGTTILAVIRDFKADGKNFEGESGDDRGLVQKKLGADHKPVFAPSGPTKTVQSVAGFEQWYRNVDGVNQPYKLEVWFAPNQGVSSFQSSAFFPLDGKGFGNEKNPHNFHFTTEIHTQFKYNAGEKFNFTGDDDVFVFLNDTLALDLGGVHGAEPLSIVVDDQAKALGLVLGQVYPFDMFQNERHTTESNFRADTDLEFVDCGTIVPEVPK